MDLLEPAAVVDQLTRAYNAGDYDAGMALIAPDAVNHGPPPMASLDEWRQNWIAARTMFPDLHAEAEQVVVQGDLVCRRLRVTGTATGGKSPTGHRIDVVGLDMVRVVGGLVVEHWALLDDQGMVAQLTASG